MLQQEEPRDYVIATGEQHSVKEFVEAACEELHINIEWQGEGIDTKGINKDTGDVIVAVDPKYYRPTEVETLLGDATEARTRLGWNPTTTFKDLVFEMVNEDAKEAVKEMNKKDAPPPSRVAVTIEDAGIPDA